MSLKKLTNNELHLATTETAKEERQVTLKLLRHLNEVARRKMFAQYEVGSLQAYCTKFLKLSDSQAARRTRAAKLLREFPQIEVKIEGGYLNLTSVCAVSGFFQQESKAGRFLDREQKAAILSEVEGLSTRAVEKLLMSRAEKPEVHLRETLRQKSAEISQLTTSLDNETREDLERLREIWSHSNPDGTLAEVLKRALRIAVKKVDPLEKAKRARLRADKNETASNDNGGKTSVVTPTSPPTVDDERPQESRISANNPKGDAWSHSNEFEFVPNNDPIPAAIQDAVRLRDDDCCTSTNPISGERCGSRWQLEFDHEIPRVVGGLNTVENLRMRCRAHNQFSAAQMFGAKTTRFWRMY